jgi:hypothetical protein
MENEFCPNCGESGDDPHNLSRLSVPVPPKIAEIFGYTGQSRFVAFYHEPAGDELMHDDGRTAATAEWYAFEQWREHPAVAAHLQDVNLGYSDLPATHWLIIDRARDVAYVAHVSTAQAFLRVQHPAPPVPTRDEIAELRRRAQERQRALDTMLAFLHGAAEADRDSPPRDGA